MKSLLIYYSRTGNTAYVAERIFDILKEKGEAYSYELSYLRFGRNMLMRMLYRFIPSLIKLAPVPTDLKAYDVLCFGIPVITGQLPAIICKYLQICKNVGRKRVMCFYVYSILPAAKSCSKYVERILKKRGNLQIVHAYIPFTEIHKKHFLDNIINETIQKLSLRPTPR